jgi:hypothetical protein
MSATKRAAENLSEVLGFGGELNDAILDIIAKIGDKLDFRSKLFPRHARAVLSRNGLWPKFYVDKNTWMWKKD